MNSRTPNNVINEQLSAFLDGELSQAELPLLLRQLDKQPELLVEAQRLQQAQLYVAGERPVQSLSQAMSFCQNIHVAINSEEQHEWNEHEWNDVRQPAAQVAFAGGQASSSVAVSQPVAANDSFWKGIAGAGIAAAVAMVAVNLWQAPQAPSGINSASTVPALSAAVETVRDIAEPETYTVPKYVSPSDTDSSSLFLQQSDLQPVSLLGNGNARPLESRLNFNADASYAPLNTQTMLIRMHEAENRADRFMQENALLHRQLQEQADMIKRLQQASAR